MTLPHGGRVHELFDRAADLPVAERAAFLDGECGSDLHLRQELEELLECEREAPASFLRGEIDPTPERLLPGQRLGAYEIVGLIGVGGMGKVYEAKQSSPRRRVALKVIRPGCLSHEARQRFRYEGEILGQLQHPGIAQIFEAGSAELEDGTELPFMAMEHVDGTPLCQHVEREGLGTRARLELVARVCDAVHHAHQRGVIHRDLKPDNVLVTAESAAGLGTNSRVGRVGQPKILDFGIARVIDPEAEARTLETRTGSLVGTLAYMSPEQVAGDSACVDVRSDVWALGVMLFEVLSGHLPIDLAGCSVPEAARHIEETDPARITQFDPTLRGDATVIVARALAKDRGRRYQTAANLAEDIRRHLRGEAIEARADSTFYVVRKALRRHCAATVGAALFLVSLTAFGVISSIQARRNRNLANSEIAARRQAEAELAAGNIERGRLFGLTHNPLGEKLIWREFLRTPESPHAFWAAWEYYSRNPCLATMALPGGEISDLVLAPDDTWLAVSSSDGRIVLLDFRTLEVLAILAQEEAVEALSLAPDGRTLAASSESGDIRLWDVASRTVSATLRGHVGMVWDMAYSPDGGRLASAGQDGTARVWDLESRTCRAVLSGQGAAVHSVSFSPDGNLLVTGGVGRVLLWTDFDGPSRSLPDAPAASVACPTFSPDGRHLFVGAADRSVRQYDVESGRLLARLEPNNGSIRRVWLGEDGKTLFARGWWRIDRWDRQTLRPLSSITLPEMGYGAASSRDGRRVVATGRHTVQVWDVDSDGGCRRLGRHEGRVAAVLSPDGELVASGDSEGTIRLWEADSGRLQRTWSEHEGRVRALAFCPDGSVLASGGVDGAIYLRNPRTGESRLLVEGAGGGTSQGLAFSPDGSLLGASFPGNVFRILSAEDGSVVTEIPTGEAQALSLRFAPDGRTVAVVARTAAVELWDLAGNHLASLASPDHTGPWTVDFSADGAKLATGLWSGVVVVFDIASRSVDHVLEGHRGTVWNVAFVPGNPDLLASCAADGTVRLWSLSLGRNVVTLDAYAGDALTVDFGPAGRRLVVAGAGEDVLVWDLAYFEQHMAGNLRFQLERLAPELGEEVPERQLLDWVAVVLAR